MKIEKQLQQFGSAPFHRSSLTSVLGGYRSVNDKIARLIAEGALVPLRKGVYVLGASLQQHPLCLPLVANVLYGPSCVSLEYAMAWHGLIPEGVFTVTSVTSRRAKTYDTPTGRYTYQHLPSELLMVGARLQPLPEGHGHFLMAGPTKALCDKMLLTRRLRLSSRSAMEAFLEEDLRLDRTALNHPEMDVLAQYLEAGHKVALLRLLKDVLAGWS